MARAMQHFCRISLIGSALSAMHHQHCTCDMQDRSTPSSTRPCNICAGIWRREAAFHDLQHVSYSGQLSGSLDIAPCWLLLSWRSHPLVPLQASAHERLLKDFSCSLCKGVLQQPLSMPCGHNFCKGCLDKRFAEAEAAQHQGSKALADAKPARTLRVRKVCCCWAGRDAVYVGCIGVESRSTGVRRPLKLPPLLYWQPPPRGWGRTCCAARPVAC